MALIQTRALYRVNPTAGVSEDSIVNTFHFLQDENQLAATAADIRDVIQGCYNTLMTWLADDFNWSAATLTFYNLNDAAPREPFVVEPFPAVVAPTTQSALPRENALCMSFQGAKLSGFSQARRRGRIYLGPFGINANTDGRPATALLDNVADGFGGPLKDASLNAADWDWVVRSALTGQTAVVTNGWVDNEWDTQRRRGRRATTRGLF